MHVYIRSSEFLFYLRYDFISIVTGVRAAVMGAKICQVRTGSAVRFWQ